MYVKLFSQILDSSIADNRRLRHFFTDLLLCADATGMVMMTDAAIARRIGATLEEVQWGLDELGKPDPMSKTPDNEGRRIERVEGHGYGWKILNYEMYRAMKDAEQLREATRERVRRHRQKKAAEKTVTPCNGSNAIAEGEGDGKAEALPPKPPEPPAAPSLELVAEENPPPSKTWTPDARQIEVASWFNRRPGTAWNEKELRAWKTIIKSFDFEGEDWQALRWFYTRSGCRFLRRDLYALLNNWNGEIDRAKNYDPAAK